MTRSARHSKSSTSISTTVTDAPSRGKKPWRAPVVIYASSALTTEKPNYPTELTPAHPSLLSGPGHS